MRLTPKVHGVEVRAVLGLWNEEGQLVREITVDAARLYQPFAETVEAYVAAILTRALEEVAGGP